MGKRSFVVVVNPRGGTRRGLAVLEQVKPVFAAAGAELDVHVTTRPGHAEELAKTIDLARSDGFCVVGGDGTIHEAVGGLMQRHGPVSTPLGIIPAGTGNSLLAHLRCSGPLEAARRIVAGRTLPLDVIRVTMGSDVAYCVSIVGWGGAVDINRTAERLRALGPPRYALAALSHILRAKRRRGRLVLDGQVVEDEFLLVVACNTRFTGKGMELAPNAEIGDGKVDVVVVRRASRVQMLKLFRRVFDGSHLSLGCVEYHQVRSFSIDSDGVDLLNLDGELKGSTPASGEVVPAALQVFA
jgi:YegS/Rv2252/BmrU family lipid kinase